MATRSPPKSWPFPAAPRNSLSEAFGSFGSLAPPAANRLFGANDLGVGALSSLVTSTPSRPSNALARLADLVANDAAYPYANALAAFAPPTTSGLGALSLVNTPAPAVVNWQYVRGRFSRFLLNLAITHAQRDDGETKQAGVRACLNRHYWDSTSETANSMLIGSWGKRTQVRPPRDVDILFLLPPAVYHRLQRRDGNRQSQLLQEVKEVLAGTYSQTRMRGDGQVIVIPFNSTPVEVSPAFRCDDGSILICDANDGGRYKLSTAEFEERDFNQSDIYRRGNTRALSRMLKQWQREHNVPLKSFMIERLAVHFLGQWPHSHQDVFWYDWMIRDFFAWLLRYVNGTLHMPGTRELIPLGDDWQFRAERAYGHALSACENEYGNYGALAGDDWQKIFGTEIPVIWS
jgi:hypothetical protein